MDYAIFPPEEIIETELTLPLSKSISARALIMAALGSSRPTEVADCDDTAALDKALAAGLTGEINIGDAGTAMRFLTAYYAAQAGAEVTLDGSERMRQRPIGRLVDALRSLGADISYAGQEGFPPLIIKGKALEGGRIDIDSTISSQYVSALLMVAPTMKTGLTLDLKGETVSMPYIRMTVSMLEQRGIDAEIEGYAVKVAPGRYKAVNEKVERDWSAAAFWYELAAISAGWVTLHGMSEKSLQGDRASVDLFGRLGVNTEFTDEGAELSASPEVFSRLDVDMTDTPDLVQPLAVTACAIGVPFRFTGVANLRIKETDRLEALRQELLKIGCVALIDRDRSIEWDGARIPLTQMPQIDTYNDHRMAMSFAPLSVFVPGIVIRNAEVVSKSYPGYWDDLRTAGFTINELNAQG